MNRILLGLIGRRIAVTALTLLIVSAIIFTITNLLPGDAAQAALGQSATPETVAALRQQFGLDMPAHVRYLHWLGGLLHGDFGRSFSGDMPVSELIGGRLPKSLTLAAITTAVSVPIIALARPWNGRSSIDTAFRSSSIPVRSGPTARLRRSSASSCW